MSFKLVDSGWGRIIEEAKLKRNEPLKIICPFIKLGAIKRLLSGASPASIRVITRFNQRDMLAKVQDISALRHLLECGAQVRGVKNLHAKLYVFGERQSILTSANITGMAFDRNHEFGFVSDEPQVITACDNYFEKFWALTSTNLELSQLTVWETTIAKHNKPKDKKPSKGLPALKDFGENVGRFTPAIVTSSHMEEASRAFVKFLGKSNDRASTAQTTLDEVISSGCHWALGYPKSQRPRQPQNGSVMFIGRLTYDPNDIKIFGRATGLKHDDTRDLATDDEIKNRPWKADWPAYIRVTQPEFIDGVLTDCVSLNDLLEELGPRAFKTTLRNLEKGHGNLNPRRTYNQKAHVELSQEGYIWINNKLEMAFNKWGKIAPDVLLDLDWPLTSRLGANKSAQFKVKPTYYNTGYFNIPTALKNDIIEGEITALLGEYRMPIIAQSRKHPKNGLIPRISGKNALKIWFQENFSIDETIEIIVEKPAEIWLRKIARQSNLSSQ